VLEVEGEGVEGKGEGVMGEKVQGIEMDVGGRASKILLEGVKGGFGSVPEMGGGRGKGVQGNGKHVGSREGGSVSGFEGVQKEEMKGEVVQCRDSRTVMGMGGPAPQQRQQQQQQSSQQQQSQQQEQQQQQQSSQQQQQRQQQQQPQVIRFSTCALFLLLLFEGRLYVCVCLCVTHMPDL
jgi:hypothetical protein